MTKEELHNLPEYRVEKKKLGLHAHESADNVYLSEGVEDEKRTRNMVVVTNP